MSRGRLSHSPVALRRSSTFSGSAVARLLFDSMEAIIVEEARILLRKQELLRKPESLLIKTKKRSIVVSMTLALEASMAERGKFRRVLSSAFLGITLAYIFFGIFGYLAFGDETKDIITLNLPNNWSALAVKVGLCIALVFTFPIMMHPIHDIMEAKLSSSGWFQKLCHRIRGAEMLGRHGVRMLMVGVMSVLASLIPGFGAFISLVGSTVCALLSFVLPATFHLTLMGSHLKPWQRLLDYGIVAVGVVFAIHGIYDAVAGPSAGS